MEVTLAIQLRGASASEHAELVERLARLGGRLIFWIRDTHGTPAQARFMFDTAAERDAFLLVALDIPGVSVVTPRLSAAASRSDFFAPLSRR